MDFITEPHFITIIEYMFYYSGNSRSIFTLD